MVGTKRTYSCSTLAQFILVAHVFLCFFCKAPCQCITYLDLCFLILVPVPFGWLHSVMPTPTYSILPYRNIKFTLCLFSLHLIFQEHNQGLKEGLGVYMQGHRLQHTGIICVCFGTCYSTGTICVYLGTYVTLHWHHLYVFRDICYITLAPFVCIQEHMLHWHHLYIFRDIDYCTLVSSVYFMDISYSTVLPLRMGGGILASFL